MVEQYLKIFNCNKKRTALLIVLLIALYSFSSAQTASVKGVIFDTINKQDIINTSVTLLRQKDSVLYKFTRSDAKGFFELNNLLPGNYLLLLTHLNYENYIEHLQLNDTSKINLGIVAMTIKAVILKEVILRHQMSAIRINGDTTEFDVNNFKVSEGASAGEMLKKLPGIQVDKDGTITAMGERVNKILVDGEEFFGNDLSIATKYLQANAIDKVQVFDKKSDQATFTGIDDGQRTKTINLQLKADKKKGYFGKLDLGAGFNDKWNSNAMINSFRNKKQFSVYGAVSSTDMTVLGMQQSNPLTSDNDDPEFNNNFVGFTSLVNNDPGFNNSFSYGEGIPKSWSGGINYSDKFNDDKQSINGSYRYNKFNSEGYGNTISQSVLPDTFFVNSESGKTFSSRQGHTLNSTYELQIDNSTSIKIRANGYKGISNSISIYNSKSQNKFGSLVNNSLRNTKTNGDNQSLQSSFLIRKKFKKTGRTISLNLSQNYSENKTDGFLYSLNSFFDKNGSTALRDTTDQKKVNEGLINTFNGKIIYTEPISKNIFAELMYAFQSSRSDAQRLSFNKDVTGKYEFLSDTFSNHYTFNVFTNIAGLAFKYNGKKVIFSVGSNIAQSNFNQKDLINDASLKRSFTNFSPEATFTYKFNRNGSLSIIYNGNTKQPSINQIQPVSDNSNPLIIITGNPLLKQEFDHNINLSYNHFNLLRQRGIFFYGSFSLQSNPIVINNFTDTLGRTVYKYVNGNGNYNYNSGFNYFINLEKPDMNVNAGLNFNKSSYSNVVNNKKSITNNTAIAINLGINKDEEKIYNFYYNGSVSYNISTTSISKYLQTKYWTQEHSFGLTVMLPLRFELNNELQASLQQKTALFDGNNNILLWNAYFGKKLLKNDKAIIKIIAHDILNQNTGYSRYISSNVIQETNYQSIARYFLLSFVWRF